MDPFDFVVIGAGPAGEAAAHKARALGASVAVVDRRWFGGSCPHIGCVPSKSLLHARRAALERRGLLLGAGLGAARLHGQPARRRRRARRRVPRPRAGDRRRASSTAARPGSRPAASSRSRTTGRPTRCAARNIVVAVGSTSKLPPLEGLADANPWTNREATLTRELPRSLLVLGGGPTGCELAQVYARFGVPVTICQSGPRLVPDRPPAQRRDDPLRARARRGHGADRRPCRPRAGPGPGPDGEHVIDLDDGTDRRGPRDPARGRARLPGGRHRPRALRRGRLGARRLQARRLAPARRRAVGGRRPGRTRAPHPPGPLPGRARGADGAGRGDRARLPRAAPRDVHGPGGGVGRA